jgi:hypothetical protein
VFWGDMMRDNAKLTSIIALIYGLFTGYLAVNLAGQITSSFPWYLLPKIVLPTLLSAVIAWGLWHRHLWAWRFGLAASVIQLGINIPSTYMLYSLMNQTTDQKIPNLPSLSYILWSSCIGITLLVVLLVLLVLPKTRATFRGNLEAQNVQPREPVSSPSLMNISISIAFAISILSSVGGKVLNSLLPSYLIQNIPVYKAHLLNSVANYWLPALIIFLGFRLTRAKFWLNPRPAIHLILGLANLLFVFYITARVVASTVQGGGASFAVIQLAPLVIYPSQLLLCYGLVWLATRYSNQRPEATHSPIKISEVIAVLIAIAIPTGFVSTFYVGEDAPIRLVLKAREVFQVKCTSVSEMLPEHPVGEIEGIYIDRDFEARYDIKDGVYAGNSVGIWGEPMVNSGWLLFFEVSDKSKNPEAKYRRHYLKDWKGLPTDSLLSTYGVFSIDLTTDVERNLGVSGTEIRIVNLESNETISSTRFFANSKERKFCGKTSNGHFSSSDFVRRALGLKMQFPSAFVKSQNPMTTPTR